MLTPIDDPSSKYFVKSNVTFNPERSRRKEGIALEVLEVILNDIAPKIRFDSSNLKKRNFRLLMDIVKGMNNL